MPQLNFYVPEEIEVKVRKAAKACGKSISAFLAELVKENVAKDKTWPAEFLSLAGSWQGDFPEVERLPPQDRDWSA